MVIFKKIERISKEKIEPLQFRETIRQIIREEVNNVQTVHSSVRDHPIPLSNDQENT